MDRDFPTRFTRRRPESIDRAGAAMQERAQNFGVAQEGDRLLDGIAFANRAEIDHHPFFAKSHRGILRVEFNQTHTDARARLLDFFRRRHTTVSSHESPASDEWRDGNIK